MTESIALTAIGTPNAFLALGIANGHGPRIRAFCMNKLGKRIDFTE
jgi:hypothetical protein